MHQWGERESKGHTREAPSPNPCFLPRVNEATQTELRDAKKQGNSQLNFMKHHQFHSFSLILLLVSNNCNSHSDYVSSRSPGVAPHEKVTLLPLFPEESGDDTSRTRSYRIAGHVRGWQDPSTSVVACQHRTPASVCCGPQNFKWRKTKRFENW